MHPYLPSHIEEYMPMSGSNNTPEGTTKGLVSHCMSLRVGDSVKNENMYLESRSRGIGVQKTGESIGGMTHHGALYESSREVFPNCHTVRTSVISDVMFSRKKLYDIPGFLDMIG